MCVCVLKAHLNSASVVITQKKDKGGLSTNAQTAVLFCFVFNFFKSWVQYRRFLQKLQNNIFPQFTYAVQVQELSTDLQSLKGNNDHHK